MTYHLNPYQTALYLEGSWSAFRVEEDVLDHLNANDISDFVLVVLATGETAFLVTSGEILER